MQTPDVAAVWARLSAVEPRWYALGLVAIVIVLALQLRRSEQLRTLVYLDYLEALGAAERGGTPVVWPDAARSGGRPWGLMLVAALATLGGLWYAGLIALPALPPLAPVPVVVGAPAAPAPAPVAPVAPADTQQPHGNPLRMPQTIMTQGYGVGTHAPAQAWGAIDLAIDGDGDGAAGSPADLSASQGTPIYATHQGVVTLTPNSYPAGNHIWIVNDAYRTGYSHLDRFADGLASGQQVARGDLIGYLGSTGLSSGPHLDYQTWVMEGGAWVNHDPHEFAPFD
jgi:murein DD-endopeptidase MepM/ murein hydrolase activator NlpD